MSTTLGMGMLCGGLEVTFRVVDASTSWSASCSFEGWVMHIEHWQSGSKNRQGHIFMCLLAGLCAQQDADAAQEQQEQGQRGCTKNSNAASEAGAAVVLYPICTPSVTQVCIGHPAAGC